MTNEDYEKMDVELHVEIRELWKEIRELLLDINENN